MDRERTIRTLAGIRTGIGVGAWVMPRLSARLFGLDPDANPQAPYLGRLFGVRDVALAGGALSSEGEAQRTWLVAGAACDAADALAGLAAMRAGYLPRVSGVLVTATALGALGLGVQALSAAEGASAS